MRKFEKVSLVSLAFCRSAALTFAFRLRLSATLRDSCHRPVVHLLYKGIAQGRGQNQDSVSHILRTCASYISKLCILETPLMGYRLYSICRNTGDGLQNFGFGLQ